MCLGSVKVGPVGNARIKDAERYYQEAAACKPADAMEWLDVEAAKLELED